MPDVSRRGCLQVMFAMRELSGPLSLLIEMVTYSSYCNEPFSLGVLQLLKVQINNKKKPDRLFANNESKLL